MWAFGNCILFFRARQHYTRQLSVVVHTARGPQSRTFMVSLQRSPTPTALVSTTIEILSFYWHFYTHILKGKFVRNLLYWEIMPIPCNFQSLEAVYRSSLTKFQVTENLNWIVLLICITCSNQLQIYCRPTWIFVHYTLFQRLTVYTMTLPSFKSMYYFIILTVKIEHVPNPFECQGKRLSSCVAIVTHNFQLIISLPCDIWIKSKVQFIPQKQYSWYLHLYPPDQW